MALLAFLGTFEWTIILLSAVTLLLLPVLSLMDLMKNKFESTTRLTWVMIILLLPFVGPILYFLIGRRQRLDE